MENDFVIVFATFLSCTIDGYSKPRALGYEDEEILFKIQRRHPVLTGQQSLSVSISQGFSTQF